MRNAFVIGLVGLVTVLVAGCGSNDVSPDAADQAFADSGEDLDPERFGDFPSEPSDQWLIGVGYDRTSFVDLATGQELPPSNVTVEFVGRGQISISAAGCGIGSGSFQFVSGRVAILELSSVMEECPPDNADVNSAARKLIESDPEIRVEGNRLLLLGADHRLEMAATGPGIVPVIEDYERYVAIKTSVAGLDPSRIELESPAYFVIKVTIPTCAFHGAIHGEAGQNTFLMQPDYGECEYSPSADLATQAFFAEGGTIRRSGDTVEVTNSQGSIHFRLATTDDPALIRETASPPPLDTPDQPDRSHPAEAGRVSEPWFANRSGSTSAGGVDVPVPEGWEAPFPSRPSAHVVGRGNLDVTFVEVGQWGIDDFVTDLELVEGPTEISVKLYKLEADQVVESGAMATVQQYRFGSSNPQEWRRQVVWILERADGVTVAAIIYPEFPDGSSFSAPDDSINQPLTGLDPVDILADIRFFE